MKTFFVDQSWKKLTGIFNLPVHQKSGKTNSRYATFTTQTAGMHDAYMKICPEMIDVETGKIHYDGAVLMRVQVSFSQSDTEKKIIKILIYPLQKREPSHEIEFKELENAIGINLKPLGDYINGREQKYSQICKLTKKGIARETVLSIALRKGGVL